MANLYVIFRDGKVFETVPILPAGETNYTCWCEDISGRAPACGEQYVESHTVDEQRQCEYRMTCDKNFFKFYGEMLDGDYDETEMKNKLRAEKQKVKDKIPKD